MPARVGVALCFVLACLTFTAHAQATVPGWYWTWAEWRLGHDEFRCQAGKPALRPDVPRYVPAWAWRRLENHRPGKCPEGVTPPPPATPAPPPAAPVLDEGERALLDAVNALRQSQGLTTLKIDARLQRAARERTADMAAFGYLAHEWSDGTPFAVWIRRYWPCNAGEILVRRTPSLTAAQAIDLWLGSPGHRANLLTPGWEYLGVELLPTLGTVDFGGPC